MSGRPHHTSTRVPERAAQDIISRSEVALVFIGGAVGVGARASLLTIPTGHMDWMILVINVSGAFLLGALTRATSPGSAARVRKARFLLGSGLLGGYTTYSTLAVATSTLLTHGQITTAIAFAGVTVIFGLMAAWAGTAIGAYFAAGRRRR